MKGKTMTRLRKANEIVLSVCLVLCIGLTASVFSEAIRIPTAIWIWVLVVGSVSFVTRAILMKKMEELPDNEDTFRIPVPAKLTEIF